MDAIRRTSTLRRVATTASLAALLIPAAQAEAKAKKAKVKPPVITSVSPLAATVGDNLTLKGKNFRKGKNKNSVGFKRDGEPVVFLRSSLSTEKTMVVPLSNKLEQILGDEPARFNLRVLTTQFGKQYTADRLSPTISPRPPEEGEETPEPGATATPDPFATPTPTPPPAPTCTAGTSDATDTDGDLLSDGLENRIGTGGCKADTDGDKITDGYEYRSAVDLNDDEYQQPNTALPYPGKRPYPNPLDGDDAARDYDGDGLPLEIEYKLWKELTPAAEQTLVAQGDDATPLMYSDGMQYSESRYCGAAETGGSCGTGNGNQNRRVPTLVAADYSKSANFRAWLASSGYATVYLRDQDFWFGRPEGRYPYDIFDVDRNNTVEPAEAANIDRDGDGFLSDDERDEDADGLGNVVELRAEMTPGYWASCYAAEPAYAIPYEQTNLVITDTDGDGVRDGADDQDFDDVPNLMELSRIAASHLNDTENGIPDNVGGGTKPCVADEDLKPEEPNHPLAFGKVNPFNPCMPDRDSRTCARYLDFRGRPRTGVVVAAIGRK